MDSVVQLPVTHLDSQLVAELSISILRHILFIREQVPTPVESILNNDLLSCHRPTIRKIESFIHDLCNVEMNIKSICSRTAIKEIQILGPSITSPKEVYSINFPFHKDRDCQGDIIPEKMRRECVRRAIRTYIQHWGEVDCQPLLSNNAYVAIKPFLYSYSTEENSEKFADVLESAPVFGIREANFTKGFATKLKRKCPPLHHVWFLLNDNLGNSRLSERHVEVQNMLYNESKDDDTNPSDNSSSMWIALKRGIRALKKLRLNS